MHMIRRGIAVMELVVAGALLGALMVVCLQLLMATNGQRRATEQRQLAVLEVENAMERLAALPWGELKAGMAAPKLSPSAHSSLPGAELKVEVTSPAAEPAAKRIVVSLRWQDRAGQFVSPIKIATWRWGK
jgi:hypothetical protein